MKISLKSIILGYYLLLGSLVLFGVVNTIYQGSLKVTHGQKVRQLENQVAQLSFEQKQLDQQISAKLSLVYLDDSLNTQDFYSISPALVIKQQNTVALK